MHFQRLRLSGFKSFVDATEFRIEPGVTGIVGPNGCGKSNLLEALRWVMGENSAKSMRGGAMDDVIFAGTNNRPSRNTAEVALVIDNALPSTTPARITGDLAVIAGDNANREFSGWDRGLRWLEDHRRSSPNDVVVLANDTFHRSYGAA